VSLYNFQQQKLLNSPHNKRGQMIPCS